MCDNSCVFEPTMINRDSDIAYRMSGLRRLREAVEGRRYARVAHLAES